MRRNAFAGFTLIELMVAMLLGLVVIAGVSSVFLANQRAYRTSQALGDVQDNTRMAFEMMARDIRDAGLTGCSNEGRVANLLNNGPVAGGSAWWANWSNTLMGYGGSQIDPVTGTGAGIGQRVAGTDALMLLGGEGLGASVKVNTEPTALFTLNEASSDFKAGDLMLVCDPDHAALVQITGLIGGVISHAGTGGAPGNCTTDLSYPTVCSSSSSYVFAANALVTRLRAAHWYVGNNPDSGRSLYRVGLVNTNGVPAPKTEEMVRGVTSMGIAYHLSGNNGFVAASDVGNWALVDAVQVHLWLESADQRAGTDDRALRRDFIATTTVRNRVN